MSGYLYAKTEQQLQRARKLKRIAFWTALASMLLFVMTISVQLFRLRLPIYLTLLPHSGFFLAGGLALLGGATVREDQEVRKHHGFGAVRNPLSKAMRRIAWTLFLFAAIMIVVSFVIPNQPR